MLAAQLVELALVEGSGNMTLERAKEIATLGLDYISVGALTHSVKGLDMSFKAC